MTPSGRTKRVLLVDDDEEIVAAVRIALDRQGYRVSVARDGSEALQRIEVLVPDLVILDVVMPRRSGFAVLDRLRLRPQRPRILMMSGQHDERLQQYARDRGVDAFLAKPFDIDRLLEIVDELLAQGLDSDASTG